jgi:hypothetical protein
MDALLQQFFCVLARHAEVEPDAVGAGAGSSQPASRPGEHPGEDLRPASGCPDAERARQGECGAPDDEAARVTGVPDSHGQECRVIHDLDPFRDRAGEPLGKDPRELRPALYDASVNGWRGGDDRRFLVRCLCGGGGGGVSSVMAAGGREPR